MDYIPRAMLDRALRRLSRRSLLDRLHAMRALAEARGVRYFDDAGRARTIEIALKPWVLTSAQLWCFHRMAQQLTDALLRVSQLHAQLERVREVVHFEPARAAWMRLAAHPAARPLAVIGRLDSTAIYDHGRWRSDFRMLEPNAVGVGGVHYAPTSCSIIMDVMGDVLARALPGRVIHKNINFPKNRFLGALYSRKHGLPGLAGSVIKRVGKLIPHILEYLPSEHSRFLLHCPLSTPGP